MRQIYLHGLGQGPDSWDKTIARLGTAGDSLCPDLAGLLQGQEAAYPNLYRAVSKVCGEWEGPVNLCGLSLGGVLALDYAIQHPEKVRSLVLIAAQYRMPERLLRLQNALFRLMPSSTFRQTGFGKAEFLRLCSSMMKLDFSGSLQRVACPVLILCGEKDSANQKAAEELAKGLKDAELRIIEGAGHEVNVDAPERLAEALRGFYDRIGAARPGRDSE